MAQSGRRLTARPVESEQSGVEINYFQEQQFIRKQLPFITKTRQFMAARAFLSFGLSKCN
jgi:hypothetical protein